MPKKKTKKVAAAIAQPGSPKFLKEGTEEFENKRRQVFQRMCAKYAWIAQQRGYVLRKNPLKLAANQPWIFHRVCKAEFGFPYINKGGRVSVWSPDSDAALTFERYYDPLFDQPVKPVHRLGDPPHNSKVREFGVIMRQAR